MTTTKTATGAVVDFIQNARFADLPADAVTIGKRCIIDGLGVMLAGSTQDAGRILHEHVQGARSAYGRHGVRSAAVQDRLGLGRARQRHERPRARLGRHAARDERGPHLRPADAPDHAAARRGARRRRAAAHLRRAVPRGVPDGLRGRVQDRRGDSPESLQEGLPLVGDHRHLRRGRRGGEAARPRRGPDGAHARDRRELGLRHPRELRQHDEAAARRPRGAERRHGRGARRARLHGRQGRARSAVGLLPDLRPRRRLRPGAHHSACSATRTRSCGPACRSSRTRAACSAIRRWTRCAGSSRSTTSSRPRSPRSACARARTS